MPQDAHKLSKVATAEKAWERRSKWREGVYAYYRQPQPTESGLTDDELRTLGHNDLMDDRTWRVAGELLELRRRIRLLTDAEG